MNRNDIDRLLIEAMRITRHHDYVIIGSLSVLGAVENPPDSMTGSIDVDLYPKNDPGRASEVATALGLGSEFSLHFGYYADAVSPILPTLPDGWEKRLIEIKFVSGVLHGFWSQTMLLFQNMCAANRVTVSGFALDCKPVYFLFQRLSIVCVKPSWNRKSEL
jgi:hypothetical protein